MQRRKSGALRRAAASPARTNEIKLHDFSSRVTRDYEYKQVFPGRVFSSRLWPTECAHRKSTTIQAPRCATERNECLEDMEERGEIGGGRRGREGESGDKE